MRMRMPVALATLMVAVCACASPAPAPAAATRSATAPTAGPASTPAPAATPSLPVTCRRLPVVNQDPGHPGGFLDVSTGLLTEDPDARLTGAPGAELDHTGGSPQLTGWPVSWPYFAGGRWVPALPAWVSPDGGRYLYPSYEASTIHLVDVRTGGDQVIFSGRRLFPVGWVAGDAYLMDWSIGQPVGLYRFSLSSGQLQAVAARIPAVLPLHGGGAWQSQVAADVPARSGPNGALANSLVRIDLVTGQSQRWYAEPNTAVTLLGFGTDGSPLVLSESAAASRLLRVTAPDQTADGAPVAIVATTVTDSRGTWMMATDGTVLLYRPGAAPVAMGKGPAGLVPAGPCQE